jgi:NADH-quinone oxidoreductase subunit M
MSWLATALWLLPVIGGFVVSFLPPRFSKWLGALVAVAELGLALGIAYAFKVPGQGYQFVDRVSWISQLHVDYYLGVDGISLWLLVLNALITLVAVLATPLATGREARFVGLMLVMSGAMAGVFLAADLVVFYVFWEAMLIPTYFLLWLWGEGDRPLYATLKFLLFTLAGSLLMLVGVIGEYVFTGAHSFNLDYLALHQPSAAVQFGLFPLFAIAFAVKVPIFPFHGWLRDAYLAAPTPMLLLFAGVMGKTGAYAMLRILIPLFHSPSYSWNWDAVMPWLAVIGITWGALMALASADMKALVAYSSLSHMGFIVLGVFSLNAQGEQGAVLQMVNHGLIVPALFLIVWWLQERTGSRDRAAVFGLAPRMPVFAGVFLVVTLAALGLPGLNSFVGEFMILLGAWRSWWLLAAVGAIGLVLAPIYMLRLFQGAMYARWTPGTRYPPNFPEDSELVATPAADLRGAQLALLAPLVVLMFAIGIYPYLLTHAMTALALKLPW